MEDTLAPETSISAPAENAAPAISEATPPTGPVDRREVLREEFKKAADPQQQQPNNRGKHAPFQPRQQGKFVPGAPQFPVPQRPEMPKSLKLELKQHWESAHPELAADIVRREADYEKGIAQYKTEAQQAKEVLQEFEPYQWILKNEGATPKTAIGPLLQTAAIFRTGSPAQKAQSIVGIMRQFAIPMEHVQQMLSGNMQQPQADPVSQIAQRVQQMEQSWAQQQQATAQQAEQRSLTVIQKFATEHPHFDALQDRILSLLQAPQILGDISAMTEAEKLQVAYDTAIRLDPALSAQALAPQQAAHQAMQGVNKAKSAAIQVTGAPGSAVTGSANKITDRRELIRQNLQAMR